MKGRGHGSGKNYDERDRFIRDIGFSSYRDYLASDLWRSIRARVYAAKGRKCVLCPQDASQLHHDRYHANDLLGKTLEFIHPLCEMCHKRIEFDEDGRKVKMKVARAVFKRLVRTTLPKRCQQCGAKSKKALLCSRCRTAKAGKSKRKRRVVGLDKQIVQRLRFGTR